MAKQFLDERVANSEHMCIFIYFHAILKTCFPTLANAAAAAAALCTFVTRMNLWRKSGSGFCMFGFLYFKQLGPEKSFSTFLSSFLDPRLTTSYSKVPNYTSRYVQALNRNLNFRKFLLSRSGRFLEKQFSSRLTRILKSVESRRKMGGQEMKTLLITSW